MTGIPKFRPATREDVVQFYGEGFSPSFRASVVEVDGRVLGIGGLYYKNEMAVAFAKYDDELAKYPLARARGAKEIMRIIGKRSCMAKVDSKPESAEVLGKLGWEHLEGDFYRWTS